jgi:hypothetical protein
MHICQCRTQVIPELLTAPYSNEVAGNIDCWANSEQMPIKKACHVPMYRHYKLRFQLFVKNLHSIYCQCNLEEFDELWQQRNKRN